MFILSGVSWFGAWVGLELNLLSFLPLVMARRESGRAEAGLKYFLVQTSTSLLVLQGRLFLGNIRPSFWLIVFGALLTKVGMAPFHIWFPMVAEGLRWGVHYYYLPPKS